MNFSSKQSVEIGSVLNNINLCVLFSIYIFYIFCLFTAIDVRTSTVPTPQNTIVGFKWYRSGLGHSRGLEMTLFSISAYWDILCTNIFVNLSYYMSLLIQILLLWGIKHVFFFSNFSFWINIRNFRRYLENKMRRETYE